MPMTHEEFEAIMTELNNPELEHTKRTEHLTALREDYKTVLSDFDEFKTKEEEWKTKKEELLEVNSKLFLSQSIKSDKKDDEKDDEEEDEITLDDLERNALQID